MNGYVVMVEGILEPLTHFNDLEQAQRYVELHNHHRDIPASVYQIIYWTDEAMTSIDFALLRID